MPHRVRLVLAVLIAFTVVALDRPVARAQALPAINLGLTSFMDGGPPAGPGFYYQNYLSYFTGTELPGSSGPATPIDADVFVNVHQFIYQHDKDLPGIGGKLGINVMLPIVVPKVSSPVAPIWDSGSGLGDLLVGPFIQWDPIMGENGPIFMHRIELSVILPTGRYRNDAVINAGANHLSFNPYWAGTLFITPRWTASYRLHYLWNDENTDPNTLLYPGAASTQAGQAIHINFTSAYEVVPRTLRIGMNGYFLKQFTDAKVDGVDSGVREQVVGIGPGLLWHISPDDHLFINAYYEFEAENRPEVWRFVVRWVHHF